jgi:DNA-binding LacI/PurR family transcriptional regulator
MESLPKYQVVFDELRREIASGKFGVGQKLPSEADLMHRFNTSRITVSRAVRDLQQSGLVERRAGSGTYVRPIPSKPVSEALTFGLLIPDLGRTDIFEPICQGMADATETADHALLWGRAISSQVAATIEERASQLCQQYVSRGVSGVFFAPIESADPTGQTNRRIVAAFDRARIPVVLLDRDYLPYPRRSPHDLVGIDNRRAGVIAAGHLLDLGCRRMVFVAEPHTAATVDERIAGFREAHLMRGLPIDEVVVQRMNPGDREALRGLMDTVRPDGFVCANDRTAGRLMHTLIALGVRIPHDVRIVGIDDLAYAGLLPVPLTTVHQPCRDIGIAAMRTMLERIRHPEMPVHDVLLETHLVVRDSCGGSAAASEIPQEPQTR